VDLPWCLPHVGNYPQACALISCSIYLGFKKPHIREVVRSPLSPSPTNHESTILLLTPTASMSHTHTATTSSSYFQSILNDATGEYERCHTRKDLLAHPLAAELEFCNSPGSIIVLIKQLAQELNLSQRIDEWRSLALARYTPGYEPVRPVPLSGRPSLKAIFMYSGVLTGVGVLYSACILPTSSIAFARAI
jgi:hypothetical protein